MAATMDSTPPATNLHPLYTRIRLATESDVPFIHKLIHQLAIYEKLTHLFQSTQESLRATLSKSPPFSSITIFLVEVSHSHLPLHDSSETSHFTPVEKTIYISKQVDDPEKEQFSSGPDMFIAGFVLFFPNYYTLMGQHGFYVDFLFVREVYRSKGLGKMMKVVASQAVRLGYGRMDWTVLDWNANAIRLYEMLGAQITKEWRICRLAGDALLSLGQE